jgi:hypothetical protein
MLRAPSTIKNSISSFTSCTLSCRRCADSHTESIPRSYQLTGLCVAHLQARHALQVDTGETQSIEKMSEAQLNSMAAAIIKKLDEFMIWLDSYPDADVTDLFSLLRSIVETT